MPGIKRAEKGGYSGEIDVRPQSSQRRYSTGSASDRPITRALGTPQRGQTIPEVDRFAIGSSPYKGLDSPLGQKGTRIAGLASPEVGLDRHLDDFLVPHRHAVDR